MLCVTAEETLPVFRNSLVPAKCFTRAKLTCPMIMPLVPCMLITCTLVVEYRICKETSKKRAKLWTLQSSARLEGLRAELSDSMRLGSASLLATCHRVGLGSQVAGTVFRGPCVPVSWFVISMRILLFFVFRVEFLLKTDRRYPKDTGVNKPWQPLRIPFAITPIGQLHQSPPSPLPGDLGRGPSNKSTCSNIETRMDRINSVVRVIRGVA